MCLISFHVKRWGRRRERILPASPCKVAEAGLCSSRGPGPSVYYGSSLRRKVKQEQDRAMGAHEHHQPCGEQVLSGPGLCTFPILTPSQDGAIPEDDLGVLCAVLPHRSLSVELAGHRVLTVATVAHSWYRCPAFLPASPHSSLELRSGVHRGLDESTHIAHPLAKWGAR